MCRDEILSRDNCHYFVTGSKEGAALLYGQVIFSHEFFSLTIIEGMLGVCMFNFWNTVWLHYS